MTFAIWLTGLPASGKSSIARALAGRLGERAIELEILESDEIRKLLTPDPRYDERERELFYRALAFSGSRLVAHRVAVIFDATANRRLYRALARAEIERFLEVFVDTPLAVCQARDPKGLYRSAAAGNASTLPGIGAAYEPPQSPEVTLDGAAVDPGDAAQMILGALESRGWLAQ